MKLRFFSLKLKKVTNYTKLKVFLDIFSNNTSLLILLSAFDTQTLAR